MKRLTTLRNLIKEQIRAVLTENQDTFDVSTTTTVRDLIEFLSKLPPDSKINGTAGIESGRSSSFMEDPDYISFSMEGNVLIIAMSGEQTDWD